MPSTSTSAQQLLVAASVKGCPIRLVKSYDLSQVKSGEELESRLLHDLRAMGAKLPHPSRSRPHGLTIKASYDAVFTPISRASPLKAVCALGSDGRHSTSLLLLPGSKLAAARKSFPYDLTEHCGLPSGLPLPALRSVAAMQHHLRMRAANETSNAVRTAVTYNGDTADDYNAVSVGGATDAVVAPLRVAVWVEDSLCDELEVRTGLGPVRVPGLRRSATVRELKHRVQQLAGFPAEEQRYELRGAALPDCARLCDAHVTDHLELRMAPQPPQPPQPPTEQEAQQQQLKEEQVHHMETEGVEGPAPRFGLAVRTPGGKTLALQGLWRGSRVEEVKACIQRMEGTCPEQQRLLSGGVQLEEGRTLADYRLESGCCLQQLLLRHCGAGMFHFAAAPSAAVIATPAGGQNWQADGGWCRRPYGRVEVVAPYDTQIVRVLLPSGGELAVCSEAHEGWAAFEDRVRTTAYAAAAAAVSPRTAGPGHGHATLPTRRSKRIRGEAPDDGAESDIVDSRREARRPRRS